MVIPLLLLLLLLHSFNHQLLVRWGAEGGWGGVDELGFRSPPPDDCSEFRTVWVFLLARWATPPSGVAASVFTATSSGHHPLAAAASNSWAQK